MKIKISALSGAALNWAVAKCEGGVAQGVYGTPELLESGLHLHYCDVLLSHPYSPSTDWAQGGSLVEREKMTLSHDEDGQTYSAYVSLFRQRGMSNRTRWRSGPTPLVAAMRCLVASQIGDEVEVPEELIATISATS